jgi:hypothetical protein
MILFELLDKAEQEQISAQVGLSAQVGQKAGAAAAAGVDISPHLQRAIDALVAETRAAEQREYVAEVRDALRVGLERTLEDELTELTAKTDETTRVYTADAARFKRFADDIGMPFCPAAPEIVAFFLLEELGNGASLATINRLSAAIAWTHKVKEAFDSTTDPLVRAAVRYATKHKSNGHGVNGANGSANAKFEGESVPDDEATEKVH